MSTLGDRPIDYKVVTSSLNPKVKEARSLLLKKYRTRTGKFLIEGARLVGDGLRVGAEIETVFFTEAFVRSPRWEQLVHAAGSQDNLTGPEWVQVPEELMAQLSDTETPQGIVAVTRTREYRTNDLATSSNPLLLVVDRIQDPGNLGTMIRTAAGAGFDGVLLTRGTVDVYSSKVLRATMGAIFRIPVLGVEVREAIEFIKDLGCQIVVGAIGAPVYHYEGDYSRSTAIVVGNEGTGPDQRWVQAADLLVQIPLAREVESLNVAAAGAILMYEAVRQRAQC